MRILIVEDEPGVRAIVRLMTECLGCDVEEAADGEQALRTVRDWQPDLVLSDVFMPNMDGLRLIRELGRQYPQVPVIGMSGGGTREVFDVLAIASRLGAAAVLSKPFTLNALLTAMAEAVGLVSSRGHVDAAQLFEKHA